MNKTFHIGRLTRDPELSQTSSGTSYCRFSIAVNHNYTVNGEKKEDVNFFNFVAWGKTGEIINQYFSKGKQILIEGRLQQRTWESDGKKNSAVDIVVERFEFVGCKEQSTGNDYQQPEPYSGDPNDITF